MTYTQDNMQANLGFAVKQTAHIEPAIYKIQYPDLDYASMLTVDNSANSFAKTVTYYSMDGTGRAEWVTGNGKDVPMVSTSMQEHETQVFTAGIGYDFGYEEVNQARMLGINLSSDKAAYARRSYEQLCYDVALLGDATKGFDGLLNSPVITQRVANPTGTGNNTVFESKSADEVLRDLNADLILTHTDTRTVEMADSIILPTSTLLELSSTRIPDTNTTILKYFRENNAYTGKSGRPLNIATSRELEDIGAGGTKRMMSYRNAADVVKLHLPMELQFLPMQREGFRFVSHGMFRLGGTDVRLPGACAYRDGI